MKLALRVVLSVLGLTLPIYAFASVANFQITATDPYNDLITGTILTTGQAGPLGSDPLAGIFTNNVISYNLIGTGPLFGTDSPVSITGPGSYLYYSGLGVVCLLSSGTVGQCPQSPGPAPGQYNQTVFNFGGTAFLSLTYGSYNPGTPVSWMAFYDNQDPVSVFEFTQFTIHSHEIPLAAVPAPSSWLMMLTGLGILFPLYRQHVKTKRKSKIVDRSNALAT